MDADFPQKSPFCEYNPLKISGFLLCLRTRYILLRRRRYTIRKKKNNFCAFYNRIQGVTCLYRDEEWAIIIYYYRVRKYISARLHACSLKFSSRSGFFIWNFTSRSCFPYNIYVIKMSRIMMTLARGRVRVCYYFALRRSYCNAITCFMQEIYARDGSFFFFFLADDR